MSTARDLLTTATDVPSDRPVEQGDLSLALAGAELADLLDAGTVTLDGDDRVVPGPPGAAGGDRLLDEAAASLVRQPPYESVEDWLWRRGEGLAAAYRAADPAAAPARRRRWIPDRSAAPAAADPAPAAPHRLRATARWTAREPVLTALAEALGIRHDPADAATALPGDAVETVVAAVNEAVTELEAVRQRRSVEDAAFDNVWRAF